MANEFDKVFTGTAVVEPPKENEFKAIFNEFEAIFDDVEDIDFEGVTATGIRGVPLEPELPRPQFPGGTPRDIRPPSKPIGTFDDYWKELINASSRGLARVGSAFETTAGSLVKAHAQLSQISQDTELLKKSRETAKMLWEISKHPELAAKKENLGGKAINLIGETIPYITATTAGYLLGGPLGAFPVAAIVEGHSFYQEAIDSGVDPKKAKNIGVAVGIVSGAIESIGGRGVELLFTRVVSKVKNKIVKGVALFGIGTIVEALEEGGQEIAAITGEKTYREVNWEETVGRTLSSMAGGAFLGGVMKGGGVGVRTLLSQAATAEPPSAALIAPPEPPAAPPVAAVPAEAIKAPPKAAEAVKVFHGTRADIDTFKPLSHFGTEKAAGQALESVKGKGKAKIISAELTLKNPLEVKDTVGVTEDVIDWVWQAEGKGVVTEKEATIIEDIVTETGEIEKAEKAFVKLLESKGYDGLKYINKTEDKGSISYVIFDPKQVSIAPPAEAITALQQVKNKAQITGKPQTIIKEGKEVDIVPDEDVSIVDDPGTLGTAETIPKIDASLKPKGKPVAARDVIFQMERDFGVPFRSKITHIFKKKIAHFQIKSKVIRAIDVRDLSTATHELGHHLDHNFFGLIHKKPPPGANQELQDLGKELYGKRKPPGGYKSEGVAEYMRIWLTGNDAENRAPFFTKWFEKYLKDNPDVAKRLNRTRKLIEKWKSQGAVARIESQIVTGPIRGTVAEQIRGGLEKLETLTLDKFAPLKRLRDEVGAHQFRPTEDPFVVATANAAKSGAKAAFFALEGTTDLAGNITGPSLQEVLKPVSKSIKDWELFDVAARARHLHSLGINPGISKTDADFVFDLFKDRVGYQKAVAGFTKWNHSGLDYMVEAGALEKSVADGIKARHPIYAPYKRAFKEGEIQQKFVPGKGFVETGSPIKKMEGSGRAIKGIISEAMKGMESMISTSQKAQVALAMANLADRFPGVGNLIVRIPAPQVPTTFSAEQIKGDILKIAVQKLGVDPTEINIAQVMDNWDEDLTVFTKGFKFTGKENVISIVRNDKRFFYEVAPDLFKTLKGLDKFTLPWYLDFWMGKANRALKLGATGLNPEFALRNFIRDLQTFGFTTEFAKGNFLSGFKGIGKDVLTNVSGVAEKFGVTIPKSQDVLRFRALGGELATFILQDKTGVKHLKSTVLAADGTKFVVNTFLHPIHVLRELVGITEVGTRIGEFGPALREGERRYGKGTADAAMFALNAAQDVTVNFSKSGTLFQILNRVIPFSNVAVQGPLKIFNSIRKNPIRSIRRGVIGLMLPAIWLWWRNKDKKWWKSLPTHEKGNYLHFENPKDPNEIFRFPVAFELGHIFQTLPVVVLDAMYQNDPSDVMEMLKFSLEQANPLDWPAAVGPIIDVKENKDFADRPIVPRSVEGKLPEDRFTQRSTRLMKFVGRKLKMSPAQLDFLVNSYSGGTYGRVARLLSSTTEAPEQKRDLPIIGTLFLRDPFAPRKEIEDFYNRFELLGQKNQSKKITKEERREFLIRNKIARVISLQWKLLRDAKNIEHRKAIYIRIERAINKGDTAINRINK